MRNLELEEAIFARPDDAEAYLMLADWLSQRGDARGELIAIQKAGHDDAAAALLDAHDHFIGGAPDADLTLRWRWGFLDEIHFHRGPDSLDESFDVARLANRVLNSDAAALLRSLRIGDLRWDYNEKDVPRLLEIAGKSPAAPRLRELHIGDVGDARIDMAHYTPGELSDIPRLFPSLTTLLVHGYEWKLSSHGALEMPRLERLVVETCALTGKELRAISGARWPALVELELWLGSEIYGCDLGRDDLAPIFDGRALPRLRHLGLGNSEFTDAICEELAVAPIARQLEIIDLSMGTMTDAGARVIADAAARGALPALRDLCVDENYLTDAGIAVLSELGFELSALDQKREREPGERYCSVWE